jgi:hypothetical protein
MKRISILIAIFLVLCIVGWSALTVGAANTPTEIKYSDYMQKNKILTFKYTLGPNTGKKYTTTKDGTETVPYESGPITGTIFQDSDPSNERNVYFYDVNTVKLLETRYKGNDYYLSTNCKLTAHPPEWSFGMMQDKMIIDQTGTWHMLNKNELLDCILNPGDQMLFIRIQDVKLQGKTYPKAVIIYYLDLKYSWVPLLFSGKESSMGITLPSDSETEGYAVTEFEIRGYNVGVIAHGDVDAETGELQYFAERLPGCFINTATH